MLDLKLQDKIPWSEIRKRTKITDVIEYTLKQNWKWACHIARMEENRWTKRCTEWHPRRGKRSRGRPSRRWQDDITENEGSPGLGKQQTDGNGRHCWRATSCSGWTKPRRDETRRVSDVSPGVLAICHQVCWWYVTRCVGDMSPCVLVICHHVCWWYVTMCVGDMSPRVLAICHQVYWWYVTRCVDDMSPGVLAIYHQVCWWYVTRCVDDMSPGVLAICQHVCWWCVTRCVGSMSPCELAIVHYVSWWCVIMRVVNMSPY